MSERTAANNIRVVKDAPKSFSENFREFLTFIRSELKPKGPVITKFNVISGIIIVVGFVLIGLRFWKGLGATTNLSQEYPWGIWIGFDVITGVAFAGGAYVLTFVVDILRFKKYEPILRATVLNGFLAYCFYAGALLLDLGRPWNVVNPIIGNGFGFSSVLFLVAWHFLLYTLCQFLEFSPVVAQWLGWPRVKKIVQGMTTGAVIFGITLSTLHQSGLGALFLLAPTKIHPLWYSHNIPILFFVSSVFAGLSMVIIESTFTHKIFADKVGHTLHANHDDILLGLGKGCAGAMFAYLFLKVIDLIHGQHYDLLLTPMGYWYLLEMIGFIVLPMILFIKGVTSRNVKLVQTTAFMTAIGIIINRLNFSVIAFKWDSAVRYYPNWIEVWVTATVICLEIWAFRWVINRMPILQDHEHEGAVETESIPSKEASKWKVLAS